MGRITTRLFLSTIIHMEMHVVSNFSNALAWFLFFSSMHQGGLDWKNSRTWKEFQSGTELKSLVTHLLLGLLDGKSSKPIHDKDVHFMFMTHQKSVQRTKATFHTRPTMALHL